MSAPHRPLPLPDHYTHTQPFWDGVARGQLLMQRCNASGRLQYPPRPVSLVTGRRDLSWVPVSGQGTLYAWTLTHVPWPGHEHRTPYWCATIELDEGVRMITHLVNVHERELRAGMPVRLVWEALTPSQRYPAFEPV